MPRIVFISDTHCRHEELDGRLPAGDILVHCGDFSARGREGEVRDFAEWLRRQPHEHKVVVAGNHDISFDATHRTVRPGVPEMARGWLAPSGAIYLQDGLVELMGLRIYGSPWQPWFHDWGFNVIDPAEIRERWRAIPEGVDVLVTHGPPRGILDRTLRGEAVGCPELMDEVASRIRPRVHAFGHIHESSGAIRPRRVPGGTLFVNASICDVRHETSGSPIVVDLVPGKRARLVKG